MSPGPVVVQPVAGSRDLNEFVALPKRLYRGRKGYVAPLDLERKETLSRKKNPFFQHAEGELFLARRGGEVVGTIGAVIDENHNKYHDERMAAFGFFETIDNQEVADALFVSVKTVETHKKNILDKLGLKNSLQLVRYAIKNNIISLDE